MIDLNHLLKNIELYKAKYKSKKIKCNVDYFVIVEEKRKALQIKTENMRALCNKLCAEVPKFKLAKKDTSELINQITILDNQINKNNKILAKYHDSINKRLQKLHNLPRYDNVYNQQLTTTFTNYTKAKLIEYIESKFRIENYNKSTKHYLKNNKNRLFQESSLPYAINCKNGYLVLCTDTEVDKIFDDLLEHFKNNSLSIIQLANHQLRQDNTASFYIHLNKKEAFYFELNKEFYTRQHSIKYRNSKIDMTKFVNQINILFKW